MQIAHTLPLPIDHCQGLSIHPDDCLLPQIGLLPQGGQAIRVPETASRPTTLVDSLVDTKRFDSSVGNRRERNSTHGSVKVSVVLGP